MQITSTISDLFHRVFDDGQGFQTQKVELDQTCLFNPFHVELRGRHIGSWIAVQRDQCVQRSITDHNTSRVCRRVSQQSFDLLPVIQQTFDDFFFAGGLAQTFFLDKRFGDRDWFDPFDRDQFGQAIHLAIRHLQHTTNVTHSGFGQ